MVSHYSSGDRPLDHRSAYLNRDPSFPSGPHLVFTFSQNTSKIFSPAEEYRQDNKELILVGSWLLGNSSAYGLHLIRIGPCKGRQKHLNHQTPVQTLIRRSTIDFKECERFPSRKRTWFFPARLLVLLQVSERPGCISVRQ